MKALEDLAGKWLEEAETLERYRDERGASLCRMHAAEVRASLANQESEVLTLAQASGESGYSKDHLRHLISDGTIPDAGRKNAPRIIRRDLPVKPGKPSSGGFDPDKEAQKIAGRIGGRR